MGTLRGALVGLDSIGADPDADEFCGFNHVQGDPSSSQYGVIAALAAFHHRLCTGEGQYIDLSMWEAVGTMMGVATMDRVMNGRIAAPQGNRHAFMSPHGIYPCQGDDMWVSIAVSTPGRVGRVSLRPGQPLLGVGGTFLRRVSEGAPSQGA